MGSQDAEITTTKKGSGENWSDLCKWTLLQKMKDHGDEYTKIKQRATKYSLVAALETPSMCRKVLCATQALLVVMCL